MPHFHLKFSLKFSLKFADTLNKAKTEEKMQGISTISGSESIDVSAYSKTARTHKNREVCEACQAKSDRFESSSVEKSKETKDPIAGFSLDEFRAAIRDELLQMLKAKDEKSPEMEIYSDIPYQVSEEEEAAEVPEEWNAENTSQRIVDFALSFRGNASDLSDEEFVEQIRSAIQDGFRLAKNDLQALPGPSAKLFNDTYSLTMEKLDKALANWSANPGSSLAKKPEQVEEATTKAASYSAVA